MKILFVCRHNASRSILAEAIARQHLPVYFEIASGGSDPKGNINPRVAKYLDDIGMDSSEFHSTSWEERLGFHPDVVITVCDTMHNESCPNWLADGIRIAWDLEPLPDQEASEREFTQQCDKILTSLKRRILRIGEMDFSSMSREEVKVELNAMKAM
jgi:arsenate reductase